MHDDDNDDQRVSTVSVKLLPCLLDVFTRMFNSKELGDRDCKLIQTLDATISIANAGFAPGWHHRGSTHHVSFPPTSLLVLASTRRHANRDTRLKPTEDFTAHRILNLLTHLHSSPSCQYIFRAATLAATEPPKTRSLASCTFAPHPPTSHSTRRRSRNGPYSTFHEQLFRSLSSLTLCNYSLYFHHCIVSTGGGVL